MKLLISVANGTEARAAVRGGADIVDIKDPTTGALGPASTEAVLDVLRTTPGQNVSVVLGEARTGSGPWGLAAYGLAQSGVRYVKVGVCLSDPAPARRLLQAVRESASQGQVPCGVIAVGFVDARPGEALPWQDLPQVAHTANVHGCLLDTLHKDGRSLFEHCPDDALAAWLAACRRTGLLTGLAGALRLADTDRIRRLAPDVVGYRTAACGGDRVNGPVQREAVAALRQALRL